MLKRYIQHNPPHSSYWMIFDIDRAGAAIDWSDRDCPAPNLTFMNLLNARAHVAYGFETGIRTAPDANLAPLKYAAAVERGLCSKLGGDFGYAGLVCKNPNHADWRVTQWQPNLYTLDWLADYLDLSASNGPQYDHDYGLGRNCTLFEKTRKWAYRAISRGWPDYRQWFAACFERAMGYNIQFPVPLSEPEVHHLAKSVARWTHKHFTERSFAEYVARTHTPKIQAARGAKGGKLSKRGSMSNSERTLKPWEDLSISRPTYYRYKKQGLL